jgi:hypothetical protein
MSDVNLSENMSKLLKSITGGILDFFNESKIQEAPNGGVRQVCSIAYKNDWTNGANYYRNQYDETVRFTDMQLGAPTTSDDDTQGFVVDSYWQTVDGTVYRCLENNTSNALWHLVSQNYSYWSESDYLRSFEDNYLMTTTAARSFVFTGSNAVTESVDIGASDGFIDIPDGVEYLFDTAQSTSQFDWASLSYVTAAAYLPASLHSITLTDSHYNYGGMITQDKIVTLLNWMATQEGFFKVRASPARTIDASASSYTNSNSLYDNTFLNIYNDLIAADWVIYLPNNNLPSALAWSTDSWTDGIAYEYHRGNGVYTYCTDPDTIYELAFGDDPATDNFIASLSVAEYPSFPNYADTTGFVNILKITQAGGDYYISP